MEDVKYYLMKEICTGEHCEQLEYNHEFVELTPDDYGLILDALYEQANQQLEEEELPDCISVKTNKYGDSLIKVAKKFEKIFSESK